MAVSDERSVSEAEQEQFKCGLGASGIGMGTGSVSSNGVTWLLFSECGRGEAEGAGVDGAGSVVGV